MPSIEIKKFSDHDHAPETDLIEAKKAVNAAKEVGFRHPEKMPAQIVRDTFADLPEEVVAVMPQRAALKRSINRTRESALPRNPLSLEDIGDLPGDYKITDHGEFFLLYDSREEDEDDLSRILIFSTRANVRLLGKSPVWFVDGTFKVAPKIYTQIFTMHGLYKGHAFPLLYVFLAGKNERLYLKAFQAFKEKFRELNIRIPDPDTIISDFELAIINACKTVFPNARVRLCFFHLGQSVWRNCQDRGLQAAYRNSEDRTVKTGVHQILSLAFVPPEDVQFAFDELQRELPQELLGLAAYFESTYIRRCRARNRQGAVAPRYPVEEWNLFRAAQQKDPRTNNMTEGWHNRFQRMVGKNHPSFYHLLREVKKEQTDTEKMIMELEMGRKIKDPSRRKYEVVTARLQSLTMQYEDYKDGARILDYLRACGHNFML